MEDTWWTRPEQLDRYQTAVISLPINADHLVTGPAGSGKTNLLVLRGAHLYASGAQNIAVLTFGRVLREFLVAGSENYEMPTNRFQTYLNWGKRLLEENELPFDAGDEEFDVVRSRLLVALRDLAALERPENVMDCILLDEAQDYSPDELAIIRRFARRIFAVGDDRQRIYRGDGALQYLRSSIQSQHNLPFHYRNGIKICRVADGIRGLVDSPDGMQSSSNYDERKNPSSVTSRPSLTVQAQVAAALPDIERQLRAYPEGFVGVLCPRNREVNEVWQHLSNSTLANQAQLHQFAEGYSAFDPDRRIVVATTHGAKGLEFRSLHLLGMDKLARFPSRRRNLAYTAVTRAKTSLTIYHEGGLMGFLDHGISAAIGGVVAPPQLADLFKGRKATS